MAALEAITANLSNRNISATYVVLDNAEAAQALRTGKTTSSYWRVRRFQRAAEASTAPVYVKWIPGHEGQITATEVSGPLSKTSAGRKARALAQNLCRDWWDSACPKRYEDLNLQMHRKKPPEMALTRAVYARLLAARTGHGDFASYHRRWNHATAPLLCECGREKSVGHLVQCRRALNRWRQISGRRRAPPLQTLLGAHGWQIFGECVQGSGIYEGAVLGMAGVSATENG
ncbi:hypothetical protein K3495_g12309 [Podosphaera aphanis]|nr:hypothetical protein K3495_g12309 [Podosphaera aphanis]